LNGTNTFPDCPCHPDDEAYLKFLKGDESSAYAEGYLGGSSAALLYFKDSAEKLSQENPSCSAIITDSSVRAWYDMVFRFGVAVQTGSGITTIEKNRMSVVIKTTRLKSTGHVELANNDPRTPPIFDHNAFSVESDLEAAGKCINLFRQIIEKANIRSAGDPTGSVYGNITFTSPAFPFGIADSVSKTTVTPALRDWMRANVIHSDSHGTNRMGKRNETNTVTDHYGRVWGTQNLYVIDGSSTSASGYELYQIMQKLTFAHLQAKSILKLHKWVPASNGDDDDFSYTAGVNDVTNFDGDQVTCKLNSKFDALNTVLDDDLNKSSTNVAAIILGAVSGVFGVTIIVLIGLMFSRGTGYTTVGSRYKNRRFQ